MAKVRTLKATGTLFIDFRYQGNRCREYTALDSSATNEKKLQKLASKIEEEIKTDTFDYASFFPGSRMVSKLGMQSAAPVVPAASPAIITAASAIKNTSALYPLFKEFAKTWVAENEVAWRRSNRKTIDDILNGHLLPAFGEIVVDEITKPDIMTFRSTLAKVPGRKAETLSAKRINAIMAPLRQILNEAADRFEFTTPFRNIKPLKILKSDVEPFTLLEVRKFLATVRTDFRNYYTVRFFTGMRTGEVDGLKWQYVDFERRQILVRETIVAGEEDTTKTEGSQREIQMSAMVYQALQDQVKATHGKSRFVFCSGEGKPLDHNNITKRVWYPLLRYLGLKSRRPYQTRHTAATLWLASGENPLWISRQLGHSSTEMLFKVYGRFVPNLTRQDGSAFERLLLQSGTVATPPTAAPGAPSPATAPPASLAPMLPLTSNELSKELRHE